MDTRPRRATEPFVGRARELTLLRERLAEARAGAGRIVLLAGEPGIGKTRLAEELAGIAAAEGVRVIWGRCYEHEGAPALWPWLQVLRAYVQDRDAATLRAELGVVAPAIAQLVPEVRDLLPDLPTPPALEAEQARFHLFDSVATFLRNAARACPLLLVLDDLHWADNPSLLLLQFLARGLHDSPLLILGAYRDAEVRRGHPLSAALADLARSAATERVELRGFDEPEVAGLLTGVFGEAAPPAVVSAVTRASDGNLFFVTEIARWLAAGDRAALREPRGSAVHIALPQTVREVIGRRLDGLSAACNQILELAAVVGREFTYTALEYMVAMQDGGLPAEAAGHRGREWLPAALEEAEAAGVIGAAPDGLGVYRFTHALIREALYEELPSTRRLRLHQQAGEALERLHSDDPEPHLAAIAHHFETAAPVGDAARAVDYARRAADQALALFAYDEAVMHYLRALQALTLARAQSETRHAAAMPAVDYEAERCELLLGLGQAQRTAGDGSEARRTFEQAAALARRLDSPERLARAALGFGTELYETTRVDEALVALLEEALATLPEEDSPVRAMLLARLSVALYYAPEGRGRSEALARQAAVMARRLHDVRTLAYVLQFATVTTGGAPIDERLALCDEQERLARATANPALALLALGWRIVCLLERGDGVATATAIDEYARRAEELRQPRYLAQAWSFRATMAMLEGRFAEVEGLAQRALAIGRQYGRTDAPQAYAAQLFLLRVLQGRAAELHDATVQFVAQSPHLLAWRCALAYLDVELGCDADARVELDRVMPRLLSDLPQDTLWLSSLCLLADAVAGLGDEDSATVLYDLLLPYEGQCVVLGAGLSCLGAAARTLGGLATALRRWDEAERHFDEALAVNARLGAAPWTARTRYDHARMLLARAAPGDDTRARELAGRSLADAEALGMTRLAQQARALVERVAPALTLPGPLPPVLPDGLTPREAEVLRLIAAGLTNREIAQALTVSEATVERHITNVYGKINARNRADATAYALRHGLNLPPVS